MSRRTDWLGKDSAMNLIQCIPESLNSRPGWLLEFPYDTDFLDEFKDSIDRPYREWLPAIKSWWVDEDCGQRLSELFENWSFPIAPIQRKPIKAIKCQRCKGTGLLPFIRPDGTISKYAKLFCPDCYNPYENVHSPMPKPSDFDFAMSYGIYRSLCWEHGWVDPGSEYPTEPEKPQEQIVIHRYSDISKQDWDLLQQTAQRVLWLEKELKKTQGKKNRYYERYVT